MDREAFEKWFLELYVKRGFVSSKAELEEAWQAAKADSAAQAPFTDKQLDNLRQAESGKLNFVTFSEFRIIARAVENAHGIKDPKP